MSLQIEQLQVHYPGASAPTVKGVSLTLSSGDIGVLIGPSGCGKTTLLRAVAGLERASAGQITLDGECLSSASTHCPPEQRRMGMVFQDYALFPHLSVARNVAFGLRHLPKAERDARVAEVLALVDLPGSGQRYPHELSGGQQQRVALARALAPRPRLMLLDEPFSNLDVDLRERLAHELRGILKSAGATALFVTHDQLEAFAIGDAVGVMHQGDLHQWGTPYDLYHQPASPFVADFVGHGVFVPAQTRTTPDGQPYLDSPIGPLPPPAPATCPPGQQCHLLLRADDIEHDDLAPVTARITRKAFRGASFLYTLELDSGETVMSLVPSHHNHAVGDRIGIRPSVNHVVTFAQI